MRHNWRCERESSAIEHSISLLKTAQEHGAGSRESLEAMMFTRRLWGIFIEDLASPANELTPEMRANIISIGLWIMRESEEIRLGRSDNIEGVIDISKIILEGLQ